MNDLIVYGSARVDAFMELPPDKAEQICKLDAKDCYIALSYANKIPLKGVKFLVGGNGANVAVGTKRLGVDSLLAAELGEGPLSDFAKSELSKELDMKFVSQTKGVDQGFGAVIVYQGERTILSYYSPVEPPYPEGSCGAPWVYLTSVGEQFETYFEKVYKDALTCKPKLVFNPSKRQIAKGADWLRKFLEITEVLMVNKEEAESILSAQVNLQEPKQLLKALVNLGPKKAVITDGRNGVFGTDGTDYYSCAIYPLEAVERTGAGDSFSAGCIAALIKGKDLRESLLWGTVNSASVVSYFGPQKGLLREGEMVDWLARAKSSGVKVEII